MTNEDWLSARVWATEIDVTDMPPEQKAKVLALRRGDREEFERITKEEFSRAQRGTGAGPMGPTGKYPPLGELFS